MSEDPLSPRVPVSPQSSSRMERRGSEEKCKQSKMSATGPVKDQWLDTLNRLARKDVVKKERFKAVLVEKMVKRASCVSLPFTIIFFIFYMMMVLAHEDVYTTYRTEKAIRNLVESVSCEGSEYKLTDAIVPLDVWRWFESSIVCKDSEWFQQMNMQGKPLPREEWARVLGTNRLYGGVLLEQSRTQRTECGVDLPYAWDCYPKEKARVPDVSTFGLWHVNQSLLPQAYAEALYFENEGFTPLAVDGADDKTRRLAIGGRPEYPINERIWDLKMHVADESYPFFFLEQESLTNLSTRLKYLQEGGWIDEQTELITMKAILVNAEVHLITKVTIIFRFGMPGGMDVAVRLQSSPMGLYKDSLGPVIDFGWLLMLCSIFTSSLKDFNNARIKGEFREYIQSLWTWVDFFTVFLGFIIILGFAVQREANELLVAAMDVVDFNRAISREYLQELYQVHRLSDSIAKGTMWYRILLGDYVLLLMLRFFKAYRAQPRLALVTNAMTAAAADLIHFAIVFLSIFMAFAYASVVLFGRRVEGFSSFWQSVATCWAIICGDLSWKEISIEHPVTAAVWFCSFMLLTYFVLLNMVLAVVMDVYTEVRAHSVLGDTLWVQLQKACWTIRQQGLRETYRSQVEDAELIHKLDQLGDEISKKEILTICPMKGEQQVDDLLSAARAVESKQESKGLSIVDAVKQIGGISVDVSDLRDMVWQLTNDRCWRHIQRKVNVVLKARSRRAKKACKILLAALQSGELNNVLYELRRSSTYKKRTQAPQAGNASLGSSRKSSIQRSGSGVIAETGSLGQPMGTHDRSEEGNGLKAEAHERLTPTGRGQPWQPEGRRLSQDVLTAESLQSLTNAVREAVRSEFQIQAQALKADAQDWGNQLKSSVCKDMREMFKLREVRKTNAREQSVKRTKSPNEGKTDKATTLQTQHMSSTAKTKGESDGMGKQSAQPVAATEPLQSGIAVAPVQGKVTVDGDAAGPLPSNGQMHTSDSNTHCSTPTPESLGKQMLALAKGPLPVGFPVEIEPSRAAEDLESIHPNTAVRHNGAAMRRQNDVTGSRTEHSEQHDAAGGPPAYSASSPARTPTHAAAMPPAVAHEALNNDNLRGNNDRSELMYYPTSFDQAVALQDPGRRQMNQSLHQPSPGNDPMMQAPNWHPHYNSGINDEGQQLPWNGEGQQLHRNNRAGITRANSAPHPPQEQFVMVSPQSVNQHGEQYVLAPHQLIRPGIRPLTANSYVPQAHAQQRPQTARRHVPVVADGSAHAPQDGVHQAGSPGPYFVRVPMQGDPNDYLI